VETPGLPRSGRRERRPRQALVLRSREAVDEGNRRKPTCSRARRPARIRRRRENRRRFDLEPRGRRGGPSWR